MPRPTVRRHVLVKIREEIGWEQKELANLVRCSVSTIKRVELGSLKLSRHLARQISEHTGVSMKYVLDNNLKRNPVTEAGDPWTKEVYEDQLKQIRELSNFKGWGEANAIMRRRRLLYSKILMDRYTSHRDAVARLPNPTVAATILACYLDAAFVDFLEEYEPATADMDKRLEDAGRGLELFCDYPRGSYQSVVVDAWELTESDKEIRMKGLGGIDGAMWELDYDSRMTRSEAKQLTETFLSLLSPEKRKSFESAIGKLRKTPWPPSTSNARRASGHTSA